jgi:hypothetical protein
MEPAYYYIKIVDFNCQEKNFDKLLFFLHQAI